jgi:hypothetical protein
LRTYHSFEIALVPVRLDHVASIIVNANHNVLSTAEMLRISDCVADCVRLAIPQATEWEHNGNEVGAAMIFARAGLRERTGNCDCLHRLS